MGAFSIFHWVIVLLIIALVVGIPVWLITRSRRNEASPGQLSGIGGWLGLLTFGLCIGVVRNLVDLVDGFPDIKDGWQTNPAARGPLALVMALALLLTATNVWAVIALLQKRRSFKRIYMGLWILAALTPFSLLAMLLVPGITIDMILPPKEIARFAVSVFVMGLWFWYLNVSVRVRNTLVN